MEKKKICIMGAGSFGTAIYKLLINKGLDVVMWSRKLDVRSCVENRDYIIFAVPAQSFREVFIKASPYIGEAICINLAKGIEISTLKRLSEIAEEILPGCKYVALSGPSHAEEISLGLPTSVSIASNNQDILKDVQNVLFTEFFRVYINNDLIGVELGGALKNVIAVVAGISDGCKLGDNARAAMMTRALAEISRLGVAMGANPLTFAGLSGMGDLVVTCTSDHSRNRRCGMLIGQDVELEQAKQQIGQVVEGIPTCYAAYELSKKYNIDMPLTHLLHAYLEKQISLDEAIAMLLARSKKAE